MITINITGNLGADAEVVERENKRFISFRMCSTDRNVSTWVKVMYYDRPNLLPYLKKGTAVHVCGEPSFNGYKDKNGEPCAGVSVFAYDLQLIGKKPADDNAPQPIANNQVFNNPQPYPIKDEEETDLPF